MADVKTSLSTGLQAYWQLDAISGQRVDSVNGAALDDTNTVTYTTGKQGNAAFFTCANSEVLSIGDAAGFDIDDGWSVSYWFKIDSTQVGGAGDYQYVFAKRSGENGVEDFVQNDAGTWYLYVGAGTGAFSSAKINTALSLNTWYHVVTYYNGASSKCYLNGSSNSISLNAITTNAASLYIGGRSGGGTANFAGAIDEFGIWNQELTQANVDTLYNSGSGIPYYESTPTGWTYEQLFNGLTTADLNGQDSWSGSTTFDVDTTAPYEGAKCVSSVLNSDSTINIDRTFTGISSGTVYVSMKVNRTAGMRRGSIFLRTGTTDVARIFFVYDASSFTQIRLLSNIAAAWVDVTTSVTNDTWFRIGIQFDDAAFPDRYRINVNGGVWSEWHKYNGAPAWSTIDTIRLSDDGNNGSGSGTMYWDTISADYTPSEATVNSGFFGLM